MAPENEAAEVAAIQQLSARYATAIDSRDLVAMVELFVPDVHVGSDASGRDELGRFFANGWLRFRRSVHFVTNHVVRLDTDDRATGTAYCLGLQEQPDSQGWELLAFLYDDRYRKDEGAWLFEQRRPHFWFRVPGLQLAEAPNEGRWRGEPMPDFWPSWGEFWERERG